MMDNVTIPLSLKDMSDLDRTFTRLVPGVVASLKDATQSASITITLNFKLCPDSETQVDMKTSIRPTFATDKKVTRCRRDLMTRAVTADKLDLGNYDEVEMPTAQKNLFAGAADADE